MNRKIKRATVAVLAMLGIWLATTAESCSGQDDTLQKDEDIAQKQLDIYQKNQPVPVNDFSQYRQSAIDIQQAQVHGVATTTFFFNQGIVDPLKTCPSIGYPVPTTVQVTNPDQKVGGDNDAVTLPLMENSGVYTGESTGTYVICVADNGDLYASYWEGFVQTEGGPAHWDAKAKQVVVDGVEAPLTNCAETPAACVAKE